MEPDEVTAILGKPMLGAIPESPTLDDPSQKLLPQERDAFQMLWTMVRYFGVDTRLSSVLVTSPGSGDGKSTVAWNLAMAASTAGLRVLLVEADLRRPSFGRTHNAPAGAGLADVLVGAVSFRDAVVRFRLPDQALAVSGNGAEPMSNAAGFDVLLAGVVPANSAQLMSSQRMEELLTEATSTTDLVIIDTPPTVLVPDAVPLLSRVSGVLVVNRIGHTTRDGLLRLRSQLELVEANVLGTVVNSLSTRDARYRYGYPTDSALTASDARAKDARHADPTPGR